jgi:hypothetical protein
MSRPLKAAYAACNKSNVLVILYCIVIPFSYLLGVLVCFWPNPAVQPNIAGCQVENLAVGATGRCQPIANIDGSSLIEG